MKKILTVLSLLFLFFLSGISPVWGEGERQISVEEVSKANRYALLIGVNRYPKQFSQLTYCEADMDALEEALIGIGFLKENIVRLSTSATDPTLLPTKFNIESNARLIADMTDEDSMLIIAFSGHGASYGDESYFCPTDTVYHELGSLVKRSDIYEIVEKCPARQKLVFVDACRNSLVMEGWKSVDGLKGLVDPVGIENPGFFIISSCKTGQYSWEDKEFGHGVFTHFLVEGLKGKAAQNGQISVHSLFTYVNYNTKNFVRRKRGMAQVPLLRGNEDELDDFLLATIRRDDVPVVQRTSSSATETTLPASLEAGTRKVFTVDGIEYAFRWCPPGEFVMGSPSDEPGRYDWEGPQHKVKITQGFWLMETEVTQAMWESVMGRSQLAQNKLADNDTDYGTGAQYPVYRVSWGECQEFCRKLGQKLGQQVQLPTEAQWEYACRAGTSGAYAGNLDEMGWYSSNSGSKTHAVGLKKPNAWGLYDMHGNVWEWCLDWFASDYYSASPTSDPNGPTSGTFRVFRGGSWSLSASRCRSANRGGRDPGVRDFNLGLRLLVVPSPVK